jgi:hypothetical protein
MDNHIINNNTYIIEAVKKLSVKRDNLNTSMPQEFYRDKQLVGWNNWGHY